MSLLNRGLQKISRIITDLGWNILSNTFQYPTTPGLHIIMYHGIDKFGDKSLNYRHISQSDFENQCIWLKKHCHLISIKDAFEGNYDANKCNVVITFDDAYRNVYTYAFPILVKYQIPCCIYSTGIHSSNQNMLWSDAYSLLQKLDENTEIKIFTHTFIKKGRHYYHTENQDSLIEFIKNNTEEFKFELVNQVVNNPLIDLEKSKDYWEIMTNEQIKEMSNYPFIEFGSHGIYHNNLGRLELTKALEEVRQSKAFLESIVNRPIESIAYPDGCYTDKLVLEVFKLGFKYQLGTEKAIETYHNINDLLKLRVGIYPIYSWKQQLIYFFKTSKSIASRKQL